MKVRSLISAAVVILLFVLIFPVENWSRWANSKTDARNAAINWVRDHVKHGSSIIVPNELTIDTRPIDKNFHIVRWRLQTLRKKEFYKQLESLNNPHVILPFFCYEGRKSTVLYKDQAHRLNNFYQYLEPLKSFNGRYRHRSKWRPFIAQTNFKNDGFDPKVMGTFQTGCLFVDKSQPGVVDGYPELAVGRLKIPFDQPVKLSPRRFNKLAHTGVQNTEELPAYRAYESPPLIFTPGTYRLTSKDTMSSSRSTSTDVDIHLANGKNIGRYSAKQDHPDVNITFEIDKTQNVPIVFTFSPLENNPNGRRSRTRDVVFLQTVIIERLQADATVAIDPGNYGLVIDSQSGFGSIKTRNIDSIENTRKGLVLETTHKDPSFVTPAIQTPLKGPSAVLKVAVTSNRKTFLKIYYTTSKRTHFSENRRLIKSLHTGFNVVAFILPGGISGPLRIDPEKSGKYILHRIEVIRKEPNYSAFFPMDYL